ncbi:MAG TPA: universal stress protein [Solirubrobacteraceae bacterium]
MYRRVIVGVDGHGGGRDAAAFAAGLGADELVLAHVVDGSGVDGLLERERDLIALDGRLETIEAPTAGAGLVLLAEELTADLLVVGSPRAARPGRVAFGETGRYVSHHAGCAVALPPRDFRLGDRRLDTIGVGYDGAPESEGAVRAAAKLATERGADLRLLAVVAPTDPFAPGRPQRLRSLAAGALLAVAPDAEVQIVRGNPRGELTRFSERVDLVCIGARRCNSTRASLLGGVSEHLARHAACPLLVTPWRAAYVDLRLAPVPGAERESAHAPSSRLPGTT